MQLRYWLLIKLTYHLSEIHQYQGHLSIIYIVVDNEDIMLNHINSFNSSPIYSTINYIYELLTFQFSNIICLIFTYYAERMSPIKNIQLFQDWWYSINVFSQVHRYLIKCLSGITFITYAHSQRFAIQLIGSSNHRT
jgi:hypothetical protein